ncbi:MAG: hypothetical protein NVSMB57_11330 [Actinomycetota bacterium]
MTDPIGGTFDSPENDGVLDAADTLESDDMLDDRLDDAVEAGDRYSAAQQWGTTEFEARQGEPLDLRLAEEEPDPLSNLDAAEASSDPTQETLLRPARIIELDEGLGPDRTAEQVGREVHDDNSGRTAEEEAMHILPNQ